MITLRAYYHPSTTAETHIHQSELLHYLQQRHEVLDIVVGINPEEGSVSQQADSYIQFSTSTPSLSNTEKKGHTNGDLNFLYTLPSQVYKVSLSVASFTINQQNEDIMLCKENIDIILDVWKSLQGYDGSTVAASMTVNCEGPASNATNEVCTNVAHQLCGWYNWKRLQETSSSPSSTALSFELVPNNKTNNRSDYHHNDASQSYCLELTTLVRPRRPMIKNCYYSSRDITPSRTFTNNKTKKKTSTAKTKRIESFAVTLTANIQPSEIVFDPLCKRGTFLIESAKYYPYAFYNGIDESLGHLQHVAMNAKSCQSIPISLQQFCWKEMSTSNVSSSEQRHLPICQATKIDKLITALPFRQRKRKYYDLLRRWFSMMDCQGQMILVIDGLSISTLIEAVDRIPHLTVIFIRKPFFRWGKHRVTIVIVSKVKDDDADAIQSTIEYGLLSWERHLFRKEVDEDEDNKWAIDSVSARDPQGKWATLRESQIPTLTSYKNAQSVQQGHHSTIFLPNGKIWGKNK
jgi:hypothetical protein